MFAAAFGLYRFENIQQLLNPSSYTEGPEDSKLCRGFPIPSGFAVLEGERTREQFRKFSTLQSRLEIVILPWKLGSSWRRLGITLRNAL